jgi:hypothetical protein
MMSKTNLVTRVTEGSPSRVTQFLTQYRGGSPGSPLIRKADRKVGKISSHLLLLFIKKFVSATPSVTAMTQCVKSTAYAVSLHRISVTSGDPRGRPPFSVTCDHDPYLV